MSSPNPTSTSDTRLNISDKTDKMGKTRLPGVPPGGVSKLFYKCKACDLHPRGCDLSKHYETNTNWKLLDEIKACVGDAAVDRLLKSADRPPVLARRRGGRGWEGWGNKISQRG